MSKDKTDIEKLLENKPLYSAIELKNLEKVDLFKYNDSKFKFYCQKDNDFKTFRLENAESRVGPFGQLNSTTKDAFGKVYSTVRFEGCCLYCNEYKVDFILNLFEKDKKFWVRKIGQYPSFSVNLDKVINDFLTNENKEFYKKALMNLSTGYGIGAFAYYRRIVENEIKRIVLSISEIDSDNSSNIKEAYELYKKDHQMSKLIDSIYQHLPNSLKELGNNPLKLLYDQLSGGIHAFSEEECLKKSEGIDYVLKFVIKQIYIEKNERSGIIDAIKKLK